MGRRTFSPEFKLEAVKLVRERGVKTSQAAQDLGLHENVLRKWVKDHAANGERAFPGRGKQRPDDAEVSPEDRQWREHLQRPETIEFIRLYYAISDPKIRRQFLEMAKTVAESFEVKAG